MSVAEALRTYTLEGAYASFEEDHKGRIAPGHVADFVVLSQDPFAIPAEQISTIQILGTVLGGAEIYRGHVI